MKTFISFIFLLLIINTPHAFSQASDTHDPFYNIKTGTKKYYILQMKNGSSHQARIISVDSKQVLLMVSDGTTLTVPTYEVNNVVEKSFESFGSIGMGFGIPYGVLGLNLDIKLYDLLYLTGGIGTGIFVTPMYNVGSKIFLRSGNYKWRPRLSGYYGTTAMLVIDDYSSNIKESCSGITAGIGQQWALGITKTWGIDFDILYIIDNREFNKRKQELEDDGYVFDFKATGNVKISFGLRYCF